MSLHGFANSHLGLTSLETSKICSHCKAIMVPYLKTLLVYLLIKIHSILLFPLLSCARFLTMKVHVNPKHFN